MAIYSFSEIPPSGIVSYVTRFIPSGPNSAFSLNLGNSGTGFAPNPTVTGTDFMGFSGGSGKLYDNENNYFFSYKNSAVEISGTVFPDYHTYFVNGVLTNTNCTRTTGAINSFLLEGLPLRSVTATFYGKTGEVTI